MLIPLQKNAIFADLSKILPDSEKRKLLEVNLLAKVTAGTHVFVDVVSGVFPVFKAALKLSAPFGGVSMV